MERISEYIEDQKGESEEDSQEEEEEEEHEEQQVPDTNHSLFSVMWEVHGNPEA